ncbi:hypothetical protein pb186bvf_013708 [Paramecium bursaria]
MFLFFFLYNLIILQIQGCFNNDIQKLIIINCNCLSLFSSKLISKQLHIPLSDSQILGIRRYQKYNLNMKNHFRLEFQCKELEQKYQKYQEQIIIKAFNTYMYIIILTNAIMCIQHVLKARWIELVINMLYASFHFSYRFIVNKYGQRFQQTIPIFFILFSAASSIYQLWIFLFAEYDESEIEVGLDICFQIVTQFTITGNHIHSTLLYFLFLIIRIYIQISRGFNFMQIGFIFYGCQYMFNEYQKAKTTRLLFLASEHNKLQKLILDDFVSDSILIFEYDNEQPRFVQQYVNKSGQQFTLDHGILNVMNEIILLQGRISIQEYVYKNFINRCKQQEPIGKFEENCYLSNNKLRLIVSGFIQKLDKQILVLKIKNFKDKLYKYDSIYINLLKKLQNKLSDPVVKKIFQQQLLKTQLKNIINNKYKIQLQPQEIKQFQIFLILRKIFNNNTIIINDVEYLYTDVGLLSIVLYLIKRSINVTEIHIYHKNINDIEEEQYIILQFTGRQIIYDKKFEWIFKKIQQVIQMIGIGEPLLFQNTPYLTFQIQLLLTQTTRFRYLKNN